MATPAAPKAGQTRPSIQIKQSAGPNAEVQNSFSAESPFFASYVDNEARSMAIMNDTLKDIAGRTKTFSKCGALMSEATRRLALACRLRRPYVPSEDAKEMEFQEQQRESEVAQRGRAVGEDMASLLAVMSEMLDEIADAQIQMCQSFEATLVTSLEHFAEVECRTAKTLRESAEQSTDSAEQLLAKYLNGRHAAGLSSTGNDAGDAGGNDAWNKFSEQVGNHGTTIFSRFQRNKQGTTRTNMSQGRNTTSKQITVSEDPEVQMASSASNLRLTLEQVRLAQATAELKRFQLLKHIVAHKQRRKFEIGENVLASLHGIRAYFHHCSDLVTGLLPTMNRFQMEQESARNILETKLGPSWRARENDIEATIDGLKQVTKSAAIIVEAIAHGDRNYIGKQATSLEEIEAQVEIWQLPALLADSTRLQRDPIPGVFVEGWLYKKSSQRIALQPWTKRWFMMDSRGIYYFKTKEENQKGHDADVTTSYLNALERVKICDVVLCTVRDAPKEGTRFCFEVCTPSEKPLMLQARGPLEFKKWVDGIRNGIELQLVHGNHSSPSLNRRKTPRRDDNAYKEFLKKSDSTGSSCGEEGDPVDLPEFHDIDNENSISEASAQAAAKLMKTKLVPQIMNANTICADCGHPNPDWVSLNLGVLMCIECSGVHRALGVHVSKIRSLKLDSLSESEAMLILAIGNDNANAIWESGAGLQKGWIKPHADAGRKAKEEWIKSKYLWRGFIDFSDDEGKTHIEREEKFCKDMYEAAKRGDVIGIAGALARGANAGWQNSEDNGKTALHACALLKSSEKEEEWKGIECAEILLQNGAKMHIRDGSSHAVLDTAVIGNADREMIEYLSMKLA